MTRTAQAATFDASAGETHMRMSDEQYFRSCVAKERQLAHLLGHQNIEECYESAGTLWAGAQALPQWTRDWRACGPLLAHYQIGIGWDAASAVDAHHPHHAGLAVRAGATRILLADHPTPDRALMFAVVREVIRVLEHPSAAKPTPVLPTRFLPQ